MAVRQQANLALPLDKAAESAHAHIARSDDSFPPILIEVLNLDPTDYLPPPALFGPTGAQTVQMRDPEEQLEFLEILGVSNGYPPKLSRMRAIQSTI